MQSTILRKVLVFTIVSFFLLTSLPLTHATGQIKKQSSAYVNVVQQEDIQEFIADHFDMVFIPKSLNDSAYNIKTMNPDILLIGYYDILAMKESYSDWDYVNQHEDWFMHDMQSNRFYHSGWKWYGMDVTSGWKDYYASQCQDFLNANPHYDGIMADDAWSDFKDNVWNPPSDPADIPPEIPEDWSDEMTGILQQTKNTIGDKTLIPNSASTGQAAIDGTFFWENFVHSPYAGLDHTGYEQEYTLHALDKFKSMSKQGHTCVAVSGTTVPANMTEGELEKLHDWQIYCLSCFLLVIDNFENNYFGWNFINSDDGSKGYFSEMDYEVGEPLGEGYKIIDTVYARDFESATVVVNVADGDNPYTVQIDGEDYTIGSKKGLILLGPNAPPSTTPPNIIWESPTPSDGSGRSENWVYLNTTITDDSDTSAFLDWEQSLVGYWSFDYYNTTGIFDNSSHENFGTFGGGGPSSLDIAPGKYGKALDFDGSYDHIDLPKDDLTSGENEVTLEFWINPDEQVPTNAIWDECATGQYWQFTVRTDNWYTRDTSTGTTGSRNNDLSLPTLTTGEWHHLAFVYSVSQSLKAIYLDGELHNSINTSIDTLTSERASARLGHTFDGTRFDGKLDEIRLHRRALSPEEIKASYSNVLHRLYHNFTSLANGSYGYTVWVIDSEGSMATSTRSVTTGSSDMTPPSITVNSPENTTYNQTPIDLDVNTDENADWCGWNLNSQGSNTTMSGPGTSWHGTIDSLSEGTHNLHVYCNDTAGNMGSASVHFTYQPTSTPPPPDNGSQVGDNVSVNVNGTVNDTVMPPDNESNETVPAQNVSGYVPKPACGNGVKEAGEECDETDGVPEGGYWCNDECKLQFPEAVSFPMYYEGDVEFGGMKFNFALLMVSVIVLLILLAVVFMLYYKEKMKKQPSRLQDKYKPTESATSKEPEAEEELEKPYVPTLSEVEQKEEKPEKPRETPAQP